MIVKRILANTAYNAVGRIWLILVNLLLTPFILSYLGDHRFALWALFWSFSVWFAFMDFGIGVSVVREVAKFAAADDVNGINKTVNSALIFNFLIGVLLFLAAWLVAHPLVLTLNLSDKLKDDALTLIRFGPLVFLLLGQMSIFDAFLRGMQRYDLITIVALAVSVINVLGIWAVVHFAYGIPGLLVAAALVYIIQMMLLALFARRTYPKLTLRISCSSIDTVRQMLPFGLHLQTARLAELASYQADKLILAVLTPLYFVTTYDLASKIASLLRQVPYLLTSAIFPAVAQLHANDDRHRLQIMYERGSKYLWMLSTPLFIGLCVTAHLVIKLWLGHVASEVYLAVLILGFGYWCTVNTSVLYNIGIGTGWSKPVMYVTLGQAIANLILSWVLALSIGYMGVLYSTAATLLLTNLLMYIWFCRDFKIEKRRDLGLFVRIFLANMPSACATLLYLHGGFVQPASTRMGTIVPLMICVGMYCVIYFTFIRVFRLLDGEDLEWLGAYCPGWVKSLLFVR